MNVPHPKKLKIKKKKKTYRVENEDVRFSEARRRQVTAAEGGVSSYIHIYRGVEVAEGLDKS